MHAEIAILPLNNNVFILSDTEVQRGVFKFLARLPSRYANALSDIHVVTGLLCWITSTHHFVEFGVTELKGWRRLSIRIASVRYNDIGSPQCFQDAVRVLFERHSASKLEVIFTSVMGVD
jgi:sorbitol-specific phosphotransferase system component IIC